MPKPKTESPTESVPRGPASTSPGDQAQLRSTLLMLFWFSIVYLPITFALAARRHLWNDELFTYYIARLASLTEIWKALLTGADQNPPLYYFLTHLGMQTCSNTLLGIRLPEILGFWLMGACLIIFVSRRLPSAFGLLASLVPLVSIAYNYAYEARPYGMVMGLGALALVCWQRAEGRRPKVWFAGLALTLAFAISTHYYSVLLFPVFALAEVVRWRTDRTLRWWAWLSLIGGAVPLILYLPLIRSATTYSGTFWAKVTALSLNEFFSYVLFPAIVPLGALLLWGMTACLTRTDGEEATAGDNRPRIPLAEVILVLGYVAIPVLAIVLALTVTGAYTHRYALPSIIGLSVCGAWMFSELFIMRTRSALIAAAMLSLFVMTKQARSLRSISSAYDHTAVTHFLEKQIAKGSAVAIVDPHLFFELSHQAPAIRDLIFYVAERELALQHLHTDAVDRGILDMSRWAPLHVRKLRDVLGSGRPFFIYGYPATYGWLVAELACRRVPMSVIESFEGRLLLFVDLERRSGGAGTQVEPVRDCSANVTARAGTPR